MNKKIISAVLIAITVMSIFCACKNDKDETTTVQPIPSKISDEDSYTIGNEFENVNEQESVASATKSVATADEFNRLLNDPERTAVGYYGSQDIEISDTDYIEKTLSIKTMGTITVNSPVFSIVTEAAKSIEINAKTDMLIVNAKDTAVNVHADTGSIVIKGTNITVNVYGGNAEKILINNSTAVVVNNTDYEITVTLTNGTKITVPSYYTYTTKTDELKQNAVA